MTGDSILDRSLRLLQGAIRASGLSQTEVDERIGRRRGYLSHVFQRRVDLKVEDLLRILAVIRVDTRVFFRAASSPERGHGAGVLELLADRLQPSGRAHPERADGDGSPGLSDPEASDADERDRELVEHVREVVRRLLAGAA